MSFAFNAIAHKISPFLTVYGQENGVSDTISSPDVPLPNEGRGASWSPGAEYLAVAHVASPFVSVYKRSGQELNKIPNPAVLPTTNPNGVSWSPDGVYLVLTFAGSPYVAIYKRAGDVLTKLPNPAVLPTGAGNRTPAWSSDGVYLSIAHTNSPYVTVYKRAGDVFTKIANPITLPTGTGEAVAWLDSTYMAVAHTSSPYVSFYKRTGDVLTKLSNPAALPLATGYGVAFSPDGNYASVSVYNTTRPLTLYKRSGDIFTAIPLGNYTQPAGASFSASWSPDSAYLSVVTQVSPFVQVYSRSGDFFTQLTAPSELPSGEGINTAYSESVPAPLPWPPQPDYYNAVAVDLQGSTALTVYAQKGTEFDPVTAPSPYNPAQYVGWGGNTYLAVGHEGSTNGGPYFSIYKRTGTTFTLLTTFGAGYLNYALRNPSGLAWSADSLYLAISGNWSGSNYLYIYRRNGDSFATVTPPTTSSYTPVSLSSDATYLAQGNGSTSTFIAKRSGTVFSFLTNTPAISNMNSNTTAWSPDDTYLAVGGSGTTKIGIYKRSGDVFSASPTVSAQPTSTVYQFSWSPDGTYLAVAINAGTKLEMYKRSGDTFTRLSVPNATNYSATGRSVAFSPDGNYVTIALTGLNNAPWLVVYERSGDTFTKLTTPTGLPTDNTYGTAYSALLNVPPTAPTLVAPADLAEVPVADPALYDWVFNDPDPGDTQSEFALVRRKVAR